MINSFIDMVNESNLNKDGLVDEMGVKRPERLTGSQRSDEESKWQIDHRLDHLLK